MNDVLALLGDLYRQVVKLTDENAALKASIAELLNSSSEEQS